MIAVAIGASQPEYGLMAAYAEGLNTLKNADLAERCQEKDAETTPLFERFASRDLDLFQNKVLSAMRFGFGGHMEKAAHE
jgi:6-phosphogluconate dehydrogenase (decarboxylating)